LIDGVAGHAQHRGDGAGAGQQACGLADVVTGEFGREERRQQAGNTQDHGEIHLRQPVALQTPEELRPHAVTDREEEHQEEHRLHIGRNRDVQLADQDTGEQYSVTLPRLNLPNFSPRYRSREPA